MMPRDQEDLHVHQDEDEAEVEEQDRRAELLEELKSIDGYILDDSGYFHGNREYTILNAEGVYRGSGWGQCFSEVLGPTTTAKLSAALKAAKAKAAAEENAEEEAEDSSIEDKPDSLEKVLAAAKGKRLGPRATFYYALNIADGSSGDEVLDVCIGRTSDDALRELCGELIVGCEFEAWDDIEDLEPYVSIF